MYTARKTELGRLRTYERELGARYAEAVLRRHFDEAKALYERRRDVRRAILLREEWQGDDGVAVTLPRLAEVEAELARVA
jgi:hypothetical protein